MPFLARMLSDWREYPDVVQPTLELLLSLAMYIFFLVIFRTKNVMFDPCGTPNVSKPIPRSACSGVSAVTLAGTAIHEKDWSVSTVALPWK